MAPSSDQIAILLPIGVAVAITFCTVVIHALAMMPVIHFVHHELRVGRAGVAFWKDVVIVAGAVVVALAAHLVAIATWALVLSLCGAFSQLEEAVYHSGLKYTTLGSAAVMLPAWRLLVPFEAANGMLMFGVSTAMLFAVIQRLIQTRLGGPSDHETIIQSGARMSESTNACETESETSKTAAPDSVARTLARNSNVHRTTAAVQSAQKPFLAGLVPLPCVPVASHKDNDIAHFLIAAYSLVPIGWLGLIKRLKQVLRMGKRDY